MHRKRGWKLSQSKVGALNPKKKRLTDLTGDTGPGDSNIPSHSTEYDLDCQTQLAGDTDLLNNSTINKLGDTDLHPKANNSNNIAQGDTDLLPNANNSTNKRLRAPISSQNRRLRAPNSYQTSCLRVPSLHVHASSQKSSSQKTSKQSVIMLKKFFLLMQFT